MWQVSTEVDAHLSYDTRATVDKALRLVELYESKGIDSRERVYIKIVRRRLMCSPLGLQTLNLKPWMGISSRERLYTRVVCAIACVQR